MALRSMTGFGSARAVIGGWQIKVELKAVNHKSLDARVNTPRGWGWLEPRALALIKRALGRGRVSMLIEAERAAGESIALGIDEVAFAQVVAQLRALSEANDLGEVALSHAFELKSLFQTSGDGAEVEDEAMFDGVIEEAIQAFDRTREEEGATILSDLLAHLEALGQNLERVRELRPTLLEGFRDRLTERLEELTSAHGVELDQERVIHEVILFSDRSDIAEEMQRAGAHLVRLRELLEGSDGPCGKKLDFYLQEMIRETNTMASKSNFSALTSVVVEMKSSIEKMREQAANVE